jgi:hypothetical protein
VEQVVVDMANEIQEMEADGGGGIDWIYLFVDITKIVYAQINCPVPNALKDIRQYRNLV